MAKADENEALQGEGRAGPCLLWFVWGASLGFMAILSLVLLVLLLVSASLNFYLGWELSGLELSISRSGSGQPVEELAIPIPTSILAAIPTNTPVPTSSPTPTPEPTESSLDPLESQIATLAAIATGVVPAPTVSTPIPPAQAIGTSAPQPDTTSSDSDDTSASAAESAVEPSELSEAMTGEAEAFAPATSSNTYSLIPIKGERESRPAEKHGDLNLALRDPQPIEVELSVIDIDGSGIDPDAPKLSSVFEPKFKHAYTIHNWDWGCDCEGELLQDDHLVLVGIETTPGEPVFIPTKEQAIYEGKYYATVLYASEDSLTFVYDNVGNVTTGYTVQYLGLHTDPNLLALFRESKGSELPGLTLDTPVGTATDELIVAIRDKGTFMDARSRKDWWN